MGLIERYKAWRERRYWQRQHTDFVRRMVNDDWRWLGANPIANELTTRYRAALSPDWFKRHHEDVSNFRERLCKLLGANTFSFGVRPTEAQSITPMQALEALDELEASARGDEPFNHFAAPLLRQFIEQHVAGVREDGDAA